MTSLHVVVPIYNEGATIGERLAKLTDAFGGFASEGYAFHYTIVDDGSCDGSQCDAQAFASQRQDVTILSHDRNRGLGAAMRTGFEHARGDVTLVVDSDLSYSPQTCMAVVERLIDERADIATASPYAPGGCVANVPWLRRILSREANRFLSFAVGGRCCTLTCMVRAYRTAVLPQLSFRSDRMEATSEIMLSALRSKLHVVEEPATLQWSEERRSAPARIKPMRILAQMWATIALAFRYVPTLWLAVPGLFPGLLPIVIAACLVLHASPAVLAIATAVTVTIQYTSLALFTGQIGVLITRSLKRNQDRRKHVHDRRYSGRSSTNAPVGSGRLGADARR